MLQFITMAWFYMICCLAVRVLKGGQAEDTRSDCEEDEEVDDVGSWGVDDEEVRDEIRLLQASVNGGGVGKDEGGSARRRREKEMVTTTSATTPLQNVFLHGKHSASQYMSPQKLAESKIGCGGDDR